MRILVVNDDGIQAEGLIRLVKAAVQLGEVWVVAPNKQCSAISQKITIGTYILLKPEPDFPVAGVHAYSVDGTPADCVKIAVEHIMDKKPDVVLSGINFGFNAGIEAAYSGTVAAAMEGLLKGIPGIAFSVEANGVYDVVDEYLLSLTKEIISLPVGIDEIWNVNFPGCTLDEYTGTLYDRPLAKTQYYVDKYVVADRIQDSEVLKLEGEKITRAELGSDLDALLNHYISITNIKNSVICSSLY